MFFLQFPLLLGRSRRAGAEMGGTSEPGAYRGVRELTDYTGNLGFSSEMSRRMEEMLTAEFGHLGYAY